MVILDYAFEYVAQGYSVIPIKSGTKKPMLQSWKKYQSCPATNKEIEEWWTKYPDANIGIVTGRGSGIVAVDIDNKDGKADERKDKILSIAPTDLISQTGSGGFHLIYKYPHEHEVGNRTNVCSGIDVRGDGGYIVAPSSIHKSGNHYVWIKRGEPGELTDGLLHIITMKTPRTDSPKDDRKWLFEILQGVDEGSRNDSAARYAGYLKGKGHSIDVAKSTMRGWNRQNRPPLDDSELEKVVDSIYKMPRPGQKAVVPEDTSEIKMRIEAIPENVYREELFRCIEPLFPELAAMPEALARAVMDTARKRFKLKTHELNEYLRSMNQLRRDSRKATKKDDPVDNRDSEKYIAMFDGLVDIVEHEGSPAFLVKENDELIVKTTVVLEGVLFLPPPRDKIPWMLPRSDEVVRYYKDDIDTELYTDVFGYLSEVSELPHKLYYVFCALWVFHTWLIDRFLYSPINCLFSVSEKGKSRTGSGLTYISYRGMVTVSLREAYLIRMANSFGGTIFFDVMDIWKKAERGGCEDVVLQRFERGSRVARVNRPDAGTFKDTDYYTIFGPTIIATNVNAHRILESRSVQINMKASSRRFENDITPENSFQMKERLCAFRARHINSPLPDADKPARGRLGDILKPLLQIVRLIVPDREADFMELVKMVENVRQGDKSESIEATVLRGVYDVYTESVATSSISVVSIANSINEDRSEKDRLSHQYIGRRLRALGFESGSKTATGGAAYHIDESLLMRLMDEYGVEKTSETSETLSTNNPDIDTEDF